MKESQCFSMISSAEADKTLSSSHIYFFILPYKYSLYVNTF